MKGNHQNENVTSDKACLEQKLWASEPGSRRLSDPSAYGLDNRMEHPSGYFFP